MNAKVNRNALQALLDKAIAHQHAGENDEAKALFMQALKLDSNNAVALYSLSAIASAQGSFAEALTHIDKVVAKIAEREKEGRSYSLIVVAEGAVPKEGTRALVAPSEIGHAERLGGVGEQVGQALAERTGKDTRVVVLGHLLRGGSPTAFDRLAALRFGTAAVRALEEGLSGVMVALAFPNVNYVTLEEVAGRMKAVPMDSDTLQTGRDLGMCFGD